MARYTKQDAEGRYYIESASEKLITDFYGHTYGEAVDRFAELESANLVEVVRCKECQHYIDGRCYVKNRKPLFTYDVNIHSRKDNDFCSYGERKE